MITRFHGWAVADERIMETRMRRAPEHVDADTGTPPRTRRRARCASRRAPSHDRSCDAGFSIVEIVATIAVMSIIMAPLFSGVIASIRASTYTRNTGQVLSALADAADRVNRAPKDCHYDDYVEPALVSIGWSKTLATVTEAYYVPGTTPAQPGTWTTSTPMSACIGGVLSPLIVQRVTITISSPDGKVFRKIEVIKSDV